MSKPKIIAIIPARGNSKGIPRKNVRLLLGKPLLAHSIQHAKECPLIDEVYVSTDNDEIAETALLFGAQVIKRPDDLALDTSSSEEALVHALNFLALQQIQPELVVFLQCTSPNRKTRHLTEAILQLQQEKADSLLSVSPSHAFLWEMSGNSPAPINYDVNRRPRRQDKKPEYWENGSFYIFKPSILLKQNNRLGGKISMYVMDGKLIDIDEPADFQLAEILLSQTEHANH